MLVQTKIVHTIFQLRIFLPEMPGIESGSGPLICKALLSSPAMPLCPVGSVGGNTISTDYLLDSLFIHGHHPPPPPPWLCIYCLHSTTDATPYLLLEHLLHLSLCEPPGPTHFLTEFPSFLCMYMNAFQMQILCQKQTVRQG